MNFVVLNSSKKWGGNERWVTTAVNGLATRGHKIYLIVRQNARHWKKIHSSVNIVEAPYTNELSIKTKSIIKRILNNNIDIMLSTKRKDYIIAAQIKYSNEIKHIMRLGISRPILKRDFIQRYVLKHMVDGIIVNAEALKSELLKYDFMKQNFDSNKIKCIYNGYDITEKSKEEISNKTYSFIVRSAGRLTAHKGYDMLIESLKNFTTDYCLEIAGEGPEYSALDDLINQYGLQNKCKLVGVRNNTINFFAGADLIVIPSRSEGIPNTLFEAWSAKKPVITTNVGGVPEVVDHKKDGIICEPNVDSIHSAINDFFQEKNIYKDLGKNGYQKLNRNFSMKHMIDELENYFDSFNDC